ncbi:MAG: CtsR family transcriptional regulator [Bacillota bacterium]|nr:CtsR family transcriptional regulator [Bacillota bacterium]
MSVLSDTIEGFIKSLIMEGQKEIELQRNELAHHFSCAPSQINYVLATRFSLDKGYAVQSRRGGGGYIRVIRLETDGEDFIAGLIRSRIGERITQHEAYAIIGRLVEAGFINEREKCLMKSSVSDNALSVPAVVKDVLRAKIMRTQLTALLCEGGGHE